MRLLEHGMKIRAVLYEWLKKSRRGLRVKMAKTKMMVTGKKIEQNIHMGRFPC